MSRFDIYDYLISAEGFPIDGITKRMISKNLEDINKLKEELGIKADKEMFNLILFDDMEHNYLEVLADLVDIGLGDNYFKIIKEAELKGSVVLMSGQYFELKPVQDKLRKEKYRTVIRRIEKEENE